VVLRLVDSAVLRLVGLAVLLGVVLRLMDSVEAVLRLADSVVPLVVVLRLVDSVVLRKVGLAVLLVAAVMAPRLVADMDLPWVRRWVRLCRNNRRRSPISA